VKARRELERIGVVGAGTMGAGIAQIAALGGYETRLHDPVPAALEKGTARLRVALTKGATKGLWSEADAEDASARAGAAKSFDELCECDLVIEAAPEDLELKRKLFAALAETCGAKAILATNTSSLPVTEIGAGVPHPERLVGMHFFNPPALMKLVEVVATAHSSREALAATTEVGRRMGRTPIQAKDSPGFIANRLARPFTLESLRMLGEGVADAATIDRVCRLAGGFRMGPFELIDLIGLDVNLSVARSFYRQGGEPERWRPSPIQARMVEEGRLGRKSGQGFYNYGDTPQPHSAVPSPQPAGKKNTGDDNPSSAVPSHRHMRERNSGAVEGAPTLDPAELGRIDPAAEAILPRLFAQIANEAAFALEEEVGSPDDMNTAMRLGFNWPRGPLELTELIGAARAAALLEELRAVRGEAYAPAPRLVGG
jgi:3-hydroxybutyryl-CoA dehydrogenase